MAVAAAAACRYRGSGGSGRQGVDSATLAGMAVTVATTAVLPPRSTAVAMKTPASTVMVGAQKINNQRKAVTAMMMQMATITATTMMMETKVMLAVAVAVVWWRRQRGGGVGSSSALAASLAAAAAWGKHIFGGSGSALSRKKNIF